ncbi:hypothetical protein Cob_v008445 [Colletotrichum orbiculare MAFF 240422]|uniref:Uncharacterized protein n=1 Tax=Colletotrichum orbiculare (strain 104-T / ATCC 96160 / CBS 514.97 / LARS 414 / MAFF 240422) TaxID=1213857 RepID=A0A484FM87_COLOR|nr:hypothetical protein Cob_v008445 [Colletotrichum orbiculare MAFF 240422]
MCEGLHCLAHGSSVSSEEAETLAEMVFADEKRISKVGPALSSRVRGQTQCERLRRIFPSYRYRHMAVWA